MAIPVLNVIFSIFRNKQTATGDHLGVYPQKVHVRALPERRYLKTSRFLVICCLISILFNFALCFKYMRDTGLVETMVYHPYMLNTYLYTLDYYNKELRPLQRPWRTVYALDMVQQALITDFITERYELTSNMEQMLMRWGKNGKLAAYLPQKKFEEFTEESSDMLRLLKQGITQKVYIYSITELDYNFYEVIFDTFLLRENVFGAKGCKCYQKDDACLDCLNKNKVGVRRYKAYMRVGVDLQNAPAQQMIASINPFNFRVKDYYAMEYRYIPQKNPSEQTEPTKKLPPYTPWEDVNNILLQ